MLGSIQNQGQNQPAPSKSGGPPPRRFSPSNQPNAPGPRPAQPAHHQKPTGPDPRDSRLHASPPPLNYGFGSPPVQPARNRPPPASRPPTTPHPPNLPPSDDPGDLYPLFRAANASNS